MTGADLTSSVQTEPTLASPHFFYSQKKSENKKDCVSVFLSASGQALNLGYTAMVLSTLFFFFFAFHIRINNGIKRFINHTVSCVEAEQPCKSLFYQVLLFPGIKYNIGARYLFSHFFTNKN